MQIDPAPQFTRALVREPSPEMVHGITTAALGRPDFAKALRQHQAYVDALRMLGLQVKVLPPTPAFPDACFVEDVALCTPKCAIVTRPGAQTRRDETQGWAEILEAHGYAGRVHRIDAPGTVEAGDVMMVGSHYYIGLSARTNASGAEQLISLLRAHGFDGSTVALRDFLHLKTGVSYLEHGHLLVTGEFVGHPAFAAFEQLVVPREEAYAANAVFVNGAVLMPTGCPQTRDMVEASGYPVVLVEMSEFEKLDGGLSCLSLRF